MTRGTSSSMPLPIQIFALVMVAGVAGFVGFVANDLQAKRQEKAPKANPQVAVSPEVEPAKAPEVHTELIFGKRVLEEIQGKVVSIADGDTITLLAEGDSIKVRLESIDCPERGQDFGEKATEAIKEKVAGQEVIVKKTGEDRYGRTLGVVFLDGRNVNEEMLFDGWAWHYVAYSADVSLQGIEDDARANRRGKWAYDQNIAPWDFRSRQQTLAQINESRSNPPPQIPAVSAEPSAPKLTHWINTSSGARHNAGCRYYMNTKKGRMCGPNDGHACGICGG